MPIKNYPTGIIPAISGQSGKYLTNNGSSLSWGSIAAADTSSMVALATGTLSGSFVAITSLPTTYKKLILTLSDVTISSGASYISVRLNTDSTADYRNWNASAGSPTNYDSIRLAGANNYINTSSTNGFFAYYTIENYSSTTSYKNGIAQGVSNSAGLSLYSNWEKYSTLRTTAITGFEILTSASTFNAGTYIVYGVK